MKDIDCRHTLALCSLTDPRKLSRLAVKTLVAIVLGLCMARMGERVRPLKNVIESVNDIINACLGFLINRFAPTAIFCMIVRGLAIYGVEYIRLTVVWMATTMVGCLGLLFVV